MLMFNFAFCELLEVEVSLHENVKLTNDRTTWPAIHLLLLHKNHELIWVVSSLSTLYFKIKFPNRILVRKCNSNPDSNPNSKSQLENPTQNPNSKLENPARILTRITQLGFHELFSLVTIQQKNRLWTPHISGHFQNSPELFHFWKCEKQ